MINWDKVETQESKRDKHLKALQEDIVKLLNYHLDAVAGERNYDDRYTCSLRAGFEGPFQQEGVVFAQWMDACNLKGYTILNDIKAGKRGIPTREQFIQEMPTIVWPESPIPKE